MNELIVSVDPALMGAAATNVENAFEATNQGKGEIYPRYNQAHNHAQAIMWPENQLEIINEPARVWEHEPAQAMQTVSMQHSAMQHSDGSELGVYSMENFTRSHASAIPAQFKRTQVTAEELKRAIRLIRGAVQRYQESNHCKPEDDGVAKNSRKRKRADPNSGIYSKVLKSIKEELFPGYSHILMESGSVYTTGSWGRQEIRRALNKKWVKATEDTRQQYYLLNTADCKLFNQWNKYRELENTKKKTLVDSLFGDGSEQQTNIAFDISAVFLNNVVKRARYLNSSGPQLNKLRIACKEFLDATAPPTASTPFFGYV
eukprot:CAMPEP_0203763346 /NCGR_PEP_ID=MMETSP0098-20131031/16055_1 /ASSEMBLY_ACC=CAM_ASM_000208 /TAXON_ID=96639 /ORGANISM=" , Strain NY0313808BC1" /LENGTH=316 /DNA_ID=CAMNT_0050658077 /DNA_START=1614 /DNA_END=2564 /DNA_ORIENTATION=-